MAHLRLLRPQQWIKNIFVFAALVFGGKGADLRSVGLTLLGFICLCLVSSVVYIINDIHDREEDKLHPRKRKRPIASGEISVATAMMMAVGLLLVGLGGSFALDLRFGIVVLTYLVLQSLYTFAFKHAVILDVISIGLGFVLRAVSGAQLLHVPTSPWLVLCTFTLCLFMGFGKRRCELNALSAENGNGDARKHRKTLALYTPELLNHMTTLTAGIAIVSFLLYAIDERTVLTVLGGGDVGDFASKCLLYTLPLVVYAIFRFAVLVEHGDVDGPTDVMLRDRPFQVALVLWLASATAIVYYAEPLLELYQKLS